MNVSLFTADDTWALWTILIVFAAFSLYAEQHWKWAEKLSGPMLGVLLAIIAVNLKIIPADAPVYDAVWTYCIPLGVSMLLFRARMRDIVKDTGKMFLCFNLTAVGTFLGGIIAFFAFRGIIPEADKLAGIQDGSFTGGSANLLAVASSTDISKSMLSADIIADNFIFIAVVFVLLWIPTSKFFMSRFPHPFQDEIDAAGRDTRTEARTNSAAFWGRTDISLLDIAMVFATAFVEVTIATKLSTWLGGVFAVPEEASLLAKIPALFLGNQFVMLTIIAVLLASLFPKYFQNLHGANELGTFLIYIFFVVIGCPSDLKTIILNAPLLFVFCALMCLTAIVFTLLTGKLLKQNIEEITVGMNACIGGPSTAAAMAVAKGYNKLVVPAILCGLWGYIIGTPLGLFLANWLASYM